MIAVSAAFLIALTVSLALTPIVHLVAMRFGSFEPPGTSFRKIHERRIPRIGGVAIVIAFYLPLVGLFLVDSQTGALFTGKPVLALGLLLGGLPIVALGLYDDLAGAGAVEKFAVQTAVALGLYGLGFRIDLVSLPFGAELSLGMWSLPLTVTWIVGLINALNLIDGLDGLAAGVATFASIAVFVVAMAHGNVLMMLFMATLVGSLIGFLVFNFNPARIFMGDTGSLFLGYIVAVTALQTSTKGAATVALLTPLLALGLPILDTTTAFCRRILRGQHPFKGDREHVHHRLLDMGFSHRDAVLVLYLVSAAFAAFAITVTVTQGPVSAAVVAAAVISIFLFGYRLRLFEWNRRKNARSRQRNQQLRQTHRRFLEQIGDARDLDTVWVALVNAMNDLDVAQLEMQPAVGGVRRRWRRDDARIATLVVERPIKTTDGEMRIAWDDGRTLLAAEEGGAIDGLLETMEQRVFTRL